MRKEARSPNWGALYRDRPENLPRQADLSRHADHGLAGAGNGCGWMAWETIVEEWRGSVSEEAIAEAVQLASKAFLEHAHEYLVEPVAA